MKKEDIDVEGRINDLNIPIVYLTSYPNEFDIERINSRSIWIYN